MTIVVEFKSGKKREFKNATGYDSVDREWFKGAPGAKGYYAMAWVIKFSKGTKVHYAKSKVQKIYRK